MKRAPRGLDKISFAVKLFFSTSIPLINEFTEGQDCTLWRHIMCVFSVGCVLRGSYCKISTNFVVNVEIVRRTKGQSPNSKVQTPTILCFLSHTAARMAIHLTVATLQ